MATVYNNSKMYFDSRVKDVKNMVAPLISMANNIGGSRPLGALKFRFGGSKSEAWRVQNRGLECPKSRS